VDRALPGDGGQAHGGDRLGLLPGKAKGGPCRVLAQAIGAARGDSDLAEGLADAAGLGEGGDEGALPVGRPAVVAAAD